MFLFAFCCIPSRRTKTRSNVHNSCFAGFLEIDANLFLRMPTLKFNQFQVYTFQLFATGEFLLGDESALSCLGRSSAADGTE